MLLAVSTATGQLAGMTTWAEADRAVKAKSHTNQDLPTNMIVQLIASTTETGRPPVHIGYPHGLDTNWFILDTAKVARPGMIIGYSPIGGSTSLTLTVRVIRPAGTYHGDRFRLPNPSVSNALWVAQTMPKKWSDSFLFHIEQSMWTLHVFDPSQDSDSDGMTDLQEWRYFNDPSTEASADADNDGVSNLDELRSATNPTNPLSYLAVSTLPPESVEAQGVRLAWYAETNLAYGIDVSTNYAGSGWVFFPVISQLVAAVPGIVVTNLPDNAPGSIFRLSAQPISP